MLLSAMALDYFMPKTLTFFFPLNPFQACTNSVSILSIICSYLYYTFQSKLNRFEIKLNTKPNINNPVSWDCKICQLHPYQWVRPPPPMSVLVMTLNHLMVRLAFWSFRM